MNHRSPSAYFLSAFLHAFVAVVILVMAFQARKQKEEDRHIFDLVAGDGDNYAATEAPRQGVPDAPKIEMPPVVRPEPRPTPPAVQPQPEPPTQQPVQPPPQTKQPVVQPVPAPTKVEPKAQPTPKAQKTPEPQPSRQQMSKAEFDRLNPQKQTSAPKTAANTPIKTQKIDVAGIRSGLTAGSSTITVGSGGTALTRAETDLLDAYAQLILQRIRAALEEAGLSDMREVRVEFRVSAAGAITSVRAVSSSGSSTFDQAVISAFRTVRPIGPPPTNRAEAFVVNVRMRDR